MLNGMSDPQQQPPVPPYASNAGQPPQPSHPPQTTPAPQQYYQGQAPQQGNLPSAQGYAQPQQGYTQPGYPTSTPASTQTDSNAPGKIGFIIGLVGIGLSLLLNVTIQILIHSQMQSYELINLVSGVFSVLVFLAGVGALVFGIIGLKRAGAPHGLAGIATGLGFASVLGTGFNFILNAVSSVFPY